MEEYISRDLVLADIEQTIEDSGCVNHERDIIDCVRYATAADVAPVVHGAWEWYEQWSESNTDHPSGCDDCGWKCSECGSALSDSILEGIGETVYCDSFQDTPKMKVCPNCYARMDGGENHDQR